MARRAQLLGAILILCAAAGMFVLTAPAASAHHKPPPPPPPPPVPGSSTTFIATYTASVGGTVLSTGPVDAQVTSDGGSIELAETTSSATGLGLNWLVKLSSTGVPQWNEEVGCSVNPGPGDYAEGVSVQQTADGGYVVGGGTIGCGTGPICPPPSGLTCALVEKLTAAGAVSWARVYQAGALASNINAIRQTSDGGYIAAGSINDINHNIGAFLLRLDSSGNVLWQSNLGPSGSVQAIFNDVQVTSDGGFVATGDYFTPTSTGTPNQVLVAKFAADGSLSWEQGYATAGSGGTLVSNSSPTSIIQTSDGGYAVSGAWGNTTFNGNAGGRGVLLLKLDPSGNLLWQQAYSGGIYCFSNGFSETCDTIDGVSYAVHQTADGGYLLGGDGDLELTDSVQLEPWLAKVSATGALVWQNNYYQTASSGRPIGAFFPGSGLTPGGGVLGGGSTEDASTTKTILYTVSADSSGQVGSSCGNVHPTTTLQAISPGLTATPPGLTAQSVATSAAASTIGTTPISITPVLVC